MKFLKSNLGIVGDFNFTFSLFLILLLVELDSTITPTMTTITCTELLLLLRTAPTHYSGDENDTEAKASFFAKVKELEDKYDYNYSPYIKSKEKLCNYINNNRNEYSNVIIIYPFNFILNVLLTTLSSS